MSEITTITVITVVYNGESLIERTMRSVQEQSWPHIEHLLIDGKSTDRTLKVVDQFPNLALRIISEKDNGIYDAMNKGIQLASGDYLIFLNAGDEFYSSDTIKSVFSNHAHADFYYGNTAIVNERGEIVGDRRLTPPETMNWRSLQYGMCVSHQSIFVRREICLSYDLNYRISADVDWTIRMLKLSRSIINTHGYIARFLIGGVSTVKRKSALMERFRIMSTHYGVVRTTINHVYISLRFVKDYFTRSDIT